MTNPAAQIKHLEQRIAYLEEISRFTHDALDMASSLGDFQANITKLEAPDIILNETRSRLLMLIRFKATAFFLIDDQTSDFVLFDCHPPEFRPFFQRESDALIENGTFARALDENRPIIVYTSDFSQQLLMHVIATVIKIRGMFIGLLNENPSDVQEISLGLLSIVLNKSANALECYDLYETINGINQELADKVERLAESEQELKRHRFHLEELVAERAAELRAANEQLKQEIAERNKAWELSRKYEAKLRQSQKLQAIGTLAGGIAHDFNNILGSILGYADMALEIASAGSPTQRYLNQVLTAGHRAKDLVEQILAFSRQDEQEKMPVCIHEIIREVIQLTQSNIPPGIEIRYLPAAEPLTVKANPTQIHRILMNLLANAIYAMKDDGGQLTISTHHQIADIDFPQGTLDNDLNAYGRITIQDSGRGMEKEILDRIFDPFFTTKPQGEGSGMGLAVVHGAVKSLGGEISAESRPGFGATFHVILPKLAPQEAIAVPPPSALQGGQERVLLVDDDWDLVRLGQEMLESLGYHVLSAQNGHAALEIFQKNPYAIDIVISDLAMTDLNGVQLAEALKQMRPDIPVILCSGFGLPLESKKNNPNSVSPILRKPWLKRDLDREIRKRLGSPQAADINP